MISLYLLFQVPDQSGAAKVRIGWSEQDAAKAFSAELGNEVGPMMYRVSEIDHQRYAEILGIGIQTPYSP